MGRSAGTPQWQLIEAAAAFKAGEAANDAKQVNSCTARIATAATEYALWLRRFNMDPSWVSQGEQFVDKVVKNKPPFTLEESILQRKMVVLKKHKEIVVYCRKVIMPAFFGFFTSLGKPPSGSQVQDAEKHVLLAIWNYQEDERMKKLNCKQDKGGSDSNNPIDLVTAEGFPEGSSSSMARTTAPALPNTNTTSHINEAEVDGSILAVCNSTTNTTAKIVVEGATKAAEGENAGEEQEAQEDQANNDEACNKAGESKCLHIRPMPSDFNGPKEYTIWRMFGPLGPEDDQSSSLIGPGETEGKPRSITSRAAQRAALNQKRTITDSISDSLSEVSGARNLSPPANNNMINSNILNESLTEMKRLCTVIEKAQELERIKLKQVSLKQQVESDKLLYELEDDPIQKSLLKSKLIESLGVLSSFQQQTAAGQP